MANIEMLKSQLASLKDKSGKTNNFWKPSSGESVVRIVPYQFNLDDPFTELKLYFNLGKVPVLSPSTFGRPDPIVEVCKELYKTGNAADKELAKKYSPTKRYYVPIIARKGADEFEFEGSKFWGMGPQVREELIGYIVDPEFGDITDPTTGRDIKLSVQTPEQAHNSFGKTTIKVSPKTSPVCTSKEVWEKIKSTQIDVLKLFKEPTYEELSDMFTKYVEATSGSDAVSSLTKPASQVFASAPSAPAVVAPKTTVTVEAKKLDTANLSEIDDLFN